MRRLTTTLTLLAALALGACGGDDGPTAQEYRADARKICQDADRATAAVRQPTRATSDAIVDYFNRLVRANEQTTERFRALDPPEELESAHERALKANSDGVAEVRRVVTELEGGGDPRKVLTDAQTRLQRLARESAGAARALGVPECADE